MYGFFKQRQFHPDWLLGWHAQQTEFEVRTAEVVVAGGTPAHPRLHFQRQRFCHPDCSGTQDTFSPCRHPGVSPRVHVQGRHRRHRHLARLHLSGPVHLFRDRQIVQP